MTVKFKFYNANLYNILIYEQIIQIHSLNENLMINTTHEVIWNITTRISVQPKPQKYNPSFAYYYIISQWKVLAKGHWRRKRFIFLLIITSLKYKMMTWLTRNIHRTLTSIQWTVVSCSAQPSLSYSESSEPDSESDISTATLRANIEATSWYVFTRSLSFCSIFSTLRRVIPRR